MPWKPKKTPAELETIFREATKHDGAWPDDMQMVLYRYEDSWRLLIGYSNPKINPFRDRLMALSVHLRELYDLADDPTNPWN